MNNIYILLDLLMIDYRGLEALFAVIQMQGFELAADKLCITQSAVTQRIKSLEAYYGEPLLVRTHPYQPTLLGERLLGHYKRVALLEETLASDLSAEKHFTNISIAINRDSLDTWFGEVIKKIHKLSKVTVEIISDDQEITLDYLKKGLVSSCLSTFGKPLSGCEVQFLGNMDYVLAASPEFKEKYFDNKKILKNKILEAPAVIFDRKDALHARYLKRFFNFSEPLPFCHYVPSVSEFRHFAVYGYGYALIPEIDIVNELKTGKLINLFPDKVWGMPIYWHSWVVDSPDIKAFNQLVTKIGQNILRYSKH